MTTAYQIAGNLLGAALAAKLDWDAFWLLHHSWANSCIRCGRKYQGRTRGWLIRHYRMTGHWREIT